MPFQSNASNSVGDQTRDDTEDQIIFVQKDDINGKLHSDCMNPFARRQPKSLFRTQVGSLQKPDQPGNKAIRLPNLSG